MDHQGADDDIRSVMARLAADFAVPTDIPTILNHVTATAVDLIDGVDFADVLLIDVDGFRSMAATDALAVELDSAQLTFDEGPCLTAAVDDATVLCPDLGSDARWPRFAAAAHESGVRSMMSFQLYSHPTHRPDVSGRGALNLYSRTHGDFSVEDRALGAMLATHAATALIAADRVSQFQSALATRDLIGQAKGVLMERFSLNAVGAFTLLTKLSQESNTKVRVIAERIVDTAGGD